MIKRKIVLLFILIKVLIAAFFVIPYKTALVFEYENSGKVLAYLPFEQEKKFQLKYIHSIHLSDVIESYKVSANEEIQLYELEYEDFAIGMPANAETGERFEAKDGKYFIKNMKRSFAHIDLRLGKVRANHTIIYQQEIYPLTKSIEPGTLVRIKVRDLNLLHRWKGVNILEE